MKEVQHQERKQAPGVPVERLERVPISAAYLAVVTRVLEEHGASLREMAEERPVGVETNAKMYEITFPRGTRRINGLVMLRSAPFELVFPDGYRLHGAQLWPLALREDDRCLNGLMLAPEEVTKEKEHTNGRHPDGTSRGA